ncbi:MAG: alanine racemase [Colwellia sp.]|nr:alanine racemase [Colwellia sp.]MCW8863266.1 alanine racemase [Colwellia sp.]MCW9083121.1 alanine racemase [Colwellia sp.]
MSYQSRKNQAVINLAALKQNYQKISALAPQSETIAVIKANSYGHGLTAVAKHLDKIAPALAVAFIDEAITLRSAGINSPILILEGPLCEQDFAIAEQENFWLMLHNTVQLNWLTKRSAPFTQKIWIKVDTGMHRLGFAPENIPKIIKTLDNEQKNNLVLCTHFSSAEELDNPKTLAQITSLHSVAELFPCQTSLANSAGIINWQQSHGDYNRLGIALYGANPATSYDLPMDLTPVMTLQSTIIALRDLNVGDKVGYGEIWQAERPSRIATIAIGYADGYPRCAKAGTPVLINGQLAPLAGRVSMDMITVDVTDLKPVKIGDMVELWGENLSVETVAKHLDTINYELLTRVSARVPRVYRT